MTDQQPPLDALADALAVLDTASLHGYTLDSAYQAALARLDGLDGDDLRAATAAVAALVARYNLLESWARHGRAVPDLDMWVAWARDQVAAGEQP